MCAFHTPIIWIIWKKYSLTIQLFVSYLIIKTSKNTYIYSQQIKSLLIYYNVCKHWSQKLRQICAFTHKIHLEIITIPHQLNKLVLLKQAHTHTHTVRRGVHTHSHSRTVRRGVHTHTRTHIQFSRTESLCLAKHRVAVCQKYFIFSSKVTNFRIHKKKNKCRYLFLTLISKKNLTFI